MVIQFLPTVLRIGSQLGPVLIHELAKPRTRRIIENVIGQGAEFAFREGKRRLMRNKPRGRNTFIMRRGRNRFQCRKVN